MNDGISLYDLRKSRLVYSAHYVAGGTNNLLSNSISSLLLFDKDVWVGTNFYLGWNHLIRQYSLFQLYKNGDFSTRNIPVRSFMHTDGYTFIGTRDGFYVADEKSGKTTFHTMGQPGTGQLRSNLIFSFYKYGPTYFIGTCHSGLYTFDPRSGTVTAHPEFWKLQSSDIFMFLTDDKGVMWIATLDGLFRYDKTSRQLKGYTPSNSNLPGDIVYGLLQDSRHRFWVATNRGVALFDRASGRFSIPPFVKRLIGNRITESVYEDRRSGNLFFITLKGELFTIDKTLRQGRKLLDDMDVVVENVIQDNRGLFWLGTNRGLLKADPEFKHIVCFSNSDEIPSFIANPGTPMAVDTSGRLWLANVKGLVTIDPSINYTPPGMRITDVLVNGVVKESLNSTGIEPLILEKSENNLTFRFARADCGSLSNVWLEYRLRGYDTSWKTVQGKDEVSYYNLPSGKYLFQVRRMLDDSSLASVEVRISEDLVWLWITSGFTMIIVCAFIYTYRKRSMKKKVAREKVAGTTSGSTVSEDEFKAVADKVKSYMEKEKPYLNVDFKQSDLVDATGYSIYLLSRMFNLYLKTGYYDFVNTYRMEEFKRLVDEGAYRTYTLKTLAEKCGFKSQASFFRTFKKGTGMTPNQYINRLK